MSEMEIVHCILRSRKTAILAMGIYGIYLEQLFAIYKHSLTHRTMCTMYTNRASNKIENMHRVPCLEIELYLFRFAAKVYALKQEF